MSTTEDRPSDGGTRRTRCEEHGVWYNVLTSSGCPVCLAQAARSAENNGAGLPVSPFRITTIVGAVVALYFGATNTIDALAGRGTQVYEESRTASGNGKLNPNAFQKEIEAVERAVFDRDRSPGRGSRVVAAAHELSEAIRNPPNSSLRANPRLAQYGQSVLLFGGAVSSTEEIGYGGYDAEFGKNEWIRVRSEVFVGANWFRSATAAVPDTLRPASGRSSRALGARILNDLTLDLENLLRFARSEMLRVGNPEFEPDSWEARKIESSWDEVRSAMAGRLRTINASLPAGKVALTAQEQDAHRYLEMSAQEIGSLAATTQVPWRNERDQRLAAARQYLEQANRVRRTGP